MEREEILLKEHEVGHNQIISVGSAIWQAASIFLSINGAVLAYFFTKKNSDPIDSLLLTVFVGVIFIIMLILWKRWMDRESSLQQIIYGRMHDIEEELGMRRNWYVYIIDQLISEEKRAFKLLWEKQIEESRLNTLLNALPQEKRSKIKQLYSSQRSSRRGGIGSTALKGFAILLMIGWGLLIIREFINVCYPEIYKILLNIICGWCN